MKILILVMCFAPSLAHAKTTVLKDLEQRHIPAFWVCGTSKILPTGKSMKTEFLIGKTATGYLLTDVLPNAAYLDILNTKNQGEAKVELNKGFTSMHLWSYSVEKGLEDKGTPTLVDIPFQSTIKECLAGGTSMLGGDCSSSLHKDICCGQKLPGAKLLWSDQVQLGYAPNSSVLLKIAGEKTPRYCNLRERLQVGRR